MDSCDVLIVGGGPAGSSCAWALRGSGLDVAVLDREFFPRDKVCGGWITPDVIERLQIDAADYARSRVFQPITGFRIGAIGGPAQEHIYGSPVSYGIRRREFDEYLLKRCGARLQLGVPLDTLQRRADSWIVNGRIQARLLIGAGGHFCPVARLTGAKPARESAVVAQEAEFEMTPQQVSACRVRGEIPELYFCADMKGYGWCFRKGNYLNIGLGRADPHQLSSHMAEFLRFLKLAGRIDFEIPAPRGHAYLLRGISTRPPSGEGFLLIGDAAGLAYAQSGEGIRPAVESGCLAAETIRASGRVYTQRELERHGAQRRSAPESRVASLGRHLPEPVIRLLARNLFRSRWFVRRVVLDEWFSIPAPWR